MYQLKEMQKITPNTVSFLHSLEKRLNNLFEGLYSGVSHKKIT